MTTTLAVCALLTTLLSVYSLGHYLCAAVFLLARARKRTFTERPTDAVAVLVPAKNEAERALRAITSILAQDHAGPVEVYLLIKDQSDSSIPFLKSMYPGADFDRAPGATVELSRADGRSVTVAYTGSDPKSDKVNWMTNRLSTKYLAILDADHQADADWLRTSICLLHEQNARIIQGRRAPISARGLFPLWDSLHQHIGCELFNAAFTKLGLTVFFTGTTAVMETSLLRDNPLTECLTEDIDFSYTIVLDGARIIDNPYSGSSEETSPDLYSFLARRRRWSNGHTSSFLGHLAQLRESEKIGFLQRFQFLYHGSHYLVSVVVFVLHLAIGLFFIQALSTPSQLAAMLASLLLGARIARKQRTIGLAARAVDVTVVFGWIFPAMVIAMNLTQAFIINDISRANLPIPYVLQAVGLIGLGAPLIVLLIGLAKFRQLSAGTFIAVVATYPVAFYLDICGVLLGMADCLTGRGRWRPVSRAPAEALVLQAIGPIGPTALLPTFHIKESWRLSVLVTSSGSTMRARVRSMTRPSRLILGAVLLAIFCVGVLYAPDSHIEVAQGNCQALDHDGEPWIVPAKKLEGYCGTPGPISHATRTGTFTLLRDDDLATVDATFWERLDSTFFCNLAQFRPENAITVPGAGLKLALEHKATPEREYSSGSISTKKDGGQFTYGRFETVMKPAKTSGVITAFFLYRFDPWQEIDTEFLGKDTTKLLVNVYYNPGQVGDLYNYGMLGTPVLIDLGFDASLDFHRYAIEWEADEIRWFVDDRLVHVRHEGRPTPIPHLPMRLFVNLWPCCSEKLAGPFAPGETPSTAEVKNVSVFKWSPSPLPNFLSRFDALFSSDGPAEWRKKAKWIQ